MRRVDDFLLEPATVITAVERIVAACQPQAILAFGSRARGDARPDSDLDLLVILRTAIADRGTLRRNLRAQLAELPLAKDILVSDPDHLSLWRGHPNSVYATALSEGRFLWRDGRIDLEAADFVCR